MRLAVVTNDVHELGPQYATTRLCFTALERGHDIHLISVGDLFYDHDETIRARSWRTKRRAYKSGATFLEDLRGPSGINELVTIDDFDVLFLRENPGKDEKRPWAQTAGIMFGRLAIERGVIVVNDPDGLSRASSKMYLQEFPEAVRPRTLITRDRERLRAFAIEQRAPIVLKPLIGSGGRNVFLVQPEDMSNINQIIEVISREGYVIAQEYLPKAAEGDTRLVVMNGSPYRYQRRYCAFQRVRIGGDLRSNLSAGGTLAQAKVTDEMLRVAELCRPRLVEDGIFIAGLDIVGDKLMEINVFSPGGIGSAQRFEKVNFAAGILEALERKVEHRKAYRHRELTNKLLATM